MNTTEIITQHENALTKLDIASWGGFTVFAVSAVIVGICLPEISKTFSTSLSEGGGMETVRNLLVFAVLLAAMLLAAHGWGGMAWAYAAYSALNAISAWLILSGRI